MKNTAVRKASQVAQALRKHAAVRITKPPAVLAQQAALNAVMLGRKGGMHGAQLSRRERLLQLKLKESYQE